LQALCEINAIFSVQNIDAILTASPPLNPVQISQCSAWNICADQDVALGRGASFHPDIIFNLLSASWFIAGPPLQPALSGFFLTCVPDVKSKDCSTWNNGFPVTSLRYRTPSFIKAYGLGNKRRVAGNDWKPSRNAQMFHVEHLWGKVYHIEIMR